MRRVRGARVRECARTARVSPVCTPPPAATTALTDWSPKRWRQFVVVGPRDLGLTLEDLKG